MNKTRIHINLYIARFLAILLVCGLYFWEVFIYNSEWSGDPILWVLFPLCLCLTVVIIVLNVIVTILVEKYISEDSIK